MDLSPRQVRERLMSAETSILAQLKRQSVNRAFVRDVLPGVIADLASATIYGSTRLRLAVFDWLIDYLLARGLGADEIQKVVDSLGSGLAPKIPRLYSLSGSEFRVDVSERIALLADRPMPVLNEIADRYLQCVLTRNRDGGRDLFFDELRNGRNVQEIYKDILIPVLNELGRLWQHDEITVADEHFSSAIIHRVLADLHAVIDLPDPSLGKVVIAGVENELHDFGARIVADLMEIDGWDTSVYGPDLPPQELCEAARQERPQIVALSVTLPSHLVEMGETVRALRSLAWDTRFAILLGGAPFATDPAICSSLGGDACAATGFDALRVARALALRSQPMRGANQIERRVRSGQTILPASERSALPPMQEMHRLSSEMSTAHRKLVKSHAAMTRLNDEKNVALGIVAHDVRNGIQAIQSATALLKQDSQGWGEVQKKLLRLIEDSASSMAALVESYLDLAKIEAGTLELRRAETDLNELVRTRVVVANLLGRSSGIEISSEATETSIVARVDPMKLSQVLDNLLRNAIQFSPTGGKVMVRTEEQGRLALISVTDQGPGVGPQQVSSLFRPFGKAAQQGRRSGNGSGLGLYIARKVVEAHGGEIWVSRVAPEGGSKFTFSIPRW